MVDGDVSGQVNTGSNLVSGQTCADLIINYLYMIGVRRIFGIPGGSIEPFFDALARHARRHPDGIKPIIARHESGAAFMAAGYARETGKLGVCCATTGPGSTNLATGVASAYVERDPILVITAQTLQKNFGRMAFQDSSDAGMDTVGMFSHVTSFSSLISHSAQLERKLIKAISSAFQQPCSPVHLSIPMDVFWDECPNDTPAYDVNKLFQPKVVVDEPGLDRLIQVVQSATKITILIGENCNKHAMDKIISFAEMTNSAIVTTPSGKTWMNAYHPLYRGVFGFAGHDSARQTLLDPAVDTLIAIGSRLGELSTSSWDSLALLNHKLVHIDSILENFTQSPMARLHVYGDMNELFKRLLEKVTSRKSASEYQKKLLPLKFKGRDGLGFTERPCIETPSSMSNLRFDLEQDAVIKPQQLMQTLGVLLPEYARVVVDTGNAWSWAIHYLHLHSSGKLGSGMNFGAMTWAIGNAIGAASADDSCPVVVITGDGSMLMSGQEITVAVAESLPVIFIVLNDAALGMVKHGQKLGGAEPIGYQLPQVDFATVARAMGANGYTVRDRRELEQLDFSGILSRPGPSLIDVYIDPEEVPPMGVRMRTFDRRGKPRPGSLERRASEETDALT